MTLWWCYICQFTCTRIPFKAFWHQVKHRYSGWQEKQIVVAGSLLRCAKQEKRGSGVSSVGKSRLFPAQLHPLCLGAWSRDSGGRKRTQYRVCTVSAHCQMQRVLWKASSQSRLFGCPVYGLCYCHTSVWEGGWKQVCLISNIIMWPCKTA